MKNSAFEQLHRTGVVAILRGIEEPQLEPTLAALYEGGVRCVEITMNTSGALRMMERARTLYDGKVSIGAGTVLEEVSARSAILAGADFILAPTLSVKVIEVCNTYGCMAVPGAFSATEVLTAWQAGAPVVKVFPCGSVGPAYIKDLRGPLPQIPMMPVGGVNLETTPAFFQAGAFAVGVGSSLFNLKLAREGKFDIIRERASQFVEMAALRKQ